VLGLAPVELNDPRQELDVAESEIDGRRANPERQRIAPDRGCRDPFEFAGAVIRRIVPPIEPAPYNVPCGPRRTSTR